jgi:predicted molibdopterin-dependent oxidoreductase YjgC
MRHGSGLDLTRERDSMVTLNIDGREITVEPGTTILEAARGSGIHIPTMCYDERLKPYGSSFFCMVELVSNGNRVTVPACVTAATDGMNVLTDTPKIREGRRKQLMLILRSHPLSCPTCDGAGHCLLQQLVKEYEVPELPFPRESRTFRRDNESPFLRFNMDVCIRCGLCVRICDEIQGESELSFVKRGTNIEVSTDFGRSLDCEFCGQCAQICPVGAISSKWLVGRGREFELTRTNTVCSFCGLGCTLTLHAKGDTVVHVTSPREGPRDGSLCVKGRYGWPYVYSDKRLRTPLVRKEGSLREASWEEALNLVAEQFTRIRESSSSPRLAALGSARLTNEEAYLFNRFARTAMGTPHLDQGGGYAYRPLTEGIAPVLGYPAGTNSIREIRDADLILLLAANLTETHPVAKNEVIMATGPMRQGRVLLVDSVRTKLSRRRGSWILTRPGTEHLIAYSMLREIVDSGLSDDEALGRIGGGLSDLAVSLRRHSPDEVANLTGTDAEAIRQAAREYARARTATIILTAGMDRRGNSVALARAAALLAMLTGRMGKRSCGIHVLGDKANFQGAIDMGLMPDRLPGFAHILDEDARKKFESAWDCRLPRERGLHARQILEAAENGRICGLYVAGENPLETYPDRQLTARVLRNLEFLVVQDLFLTPTAQAADVVLPAQSFTEKVGTYTNAERRIQRLQPIRESVGPRSDLEILLSLADLMGVPSMRNSNPEQVMEEIAELVDAYRGISYGRLNDGGLQWPCRDSNDPGSAILFESGFPEQEPPAVHVTPLETESAEGFDLSLIPTTLKFHSGSLSQWSESLMEVYPQGEAEMNRQDMMERGLRGGDLIKITGAPGASIVVPVRASSRALPGSVIVPGNLPSLGINELLGWEHPPARVNVEKV